eukprot:CAMPEP_0117605430 /NCGR_PEP_ID=MMETSP0784-20121206/79190_1 /TAXON_ID=39447 /ORGANISM="" /LENGTH=165 /DNA_ID=CAMNT_0005408475 /DNA_START=89 /DNA_END=586 /DNA_ORIENTATION=-
MMAVAGFALFMRWTVTFYLVALATILVLWLRWRESCKAKEALRIWRERAAKMKLTPRSDWTLDEIKAYDGSDQELPIVIAVDGEVFNVWRGAEFYGPGAAYHVFAGRDASRLLAKHILKDSEDNGEALTPKELATLQDWKHHFGRKYGSVGTLAQAEESSTLRSF